MMLTKGLSGLNAVSGAGRHATRTGAPVQMMGSLSGVRGLSGYSTSTVSKWAQVADVIRSLRNNGYPNADCIEYLEDGVYKQACGLFPGMRFNIAAMDIYDPNTREITAAAKSSLPYSNDYQPESEIDAEALDMGYRAAGSVQNWVGGSDRDAVMYAAAREYRRTLNVEGMTALAVNIGAGRIKVVPSTPRIIPPVSDIAPVVNTPTVRAPDITATPAGSNVLVTGGALATPTSTAAQVAAGNTNLTPASTSYTSGAVSAAGTSVNTGAVSSGFSLDSLGENKTLILVGAAVVLFMMMKK